MLPNTLPKYFNVKLQQMNCFFDTVFFPYFLHIMKNSRFYAIVWQNKMRRNKRKNQQSFIDNIMATNCSLVSPVVDVDDDGTFPVA